MQTELKLVAFLASQHGISLKIQGASNNMARDCKNQFYNGMLQSEENISYSNLDNNASTAKFE